MILADIEAKLREIDPNVYYGIADEPDDETVFDYVVFNRTILRHSTNKTGMSDYFDVHIVRENYIPEGLDAQVIKSLCELEGVRVAGNDATFNYVKKPNTNVVVEILTIPFLRARKADA